MPAKVGGDNAGNRITIDQTGLGPIELRVTPEAPTTMNGAAATVVFTGIIKGLIAHLGEGAKALAASDVTIAGGGVSTGARCPTT